MKLERKAIELPSPLMICKFSDKELEFTGQLVIDTAIRGKCCGGVRLSTVVSLKETTCLAKNMTLKYAFLGIPLGGAKVGIRIEGQLTKTKRKLVFTKVGKILSPLITNGSYVTGPDMGTSYEDIDWLLNAATNEKKKREHVDTALYTSWTMLNSAAEALKELGLKLDNSTVAIEGFGKIGSSSAKFFSENGVKVIAISTCKGAIYHSKGFDVKKLLEIKAKYGDDVVNHYVDAEKITKDELLCLPVDILLPCAAPWTVNSRNAHKIMARIICPGANLPITGEAEKILFNNKIICLPDFVSNSGGVLGSFMGSMVTEQDKKEIIEKYFSKRVSRVLKISREEGIPPIEVAEKIAVKRFHSIKYKSEMPDFKIRMSYIVKLMISKVYRKIFINPRAMKIFSDMLR
jgi:glutamate dehydrogenase (NAD(P)+)